MTLPQIGAGFCHVLVEIQECPEKRCGGEVVHGERAMGIVIDVVLFSSMTAFVAGVVVVLAKFLI